MTTHDPFAGKIALVTGAASGIGSALAGLLVRRGAIVEASDLDGAEVATTGVHRARAVDVTDGPAVTTWVEDAARRHGRIDLMFNNAGIGVGGEAQQLTLDDWTRVLDVNLRGVIHGVHAAYPIMVRQRAGHLINVASVAGLAPYPFALPYTTSKHAVVGLSTALRAEAAAYGVVVSVACPGVIRTPIWDRSTVRGWAPAAARAALETSVPRWTSPEACARAILAGVERRRGVILITAEARVAWWLNRMSPVLAGRAARLIIGRLRRARTASREGGHVVS